MKSIIKFVVFSLFILIIFTFLSACADQAFQDKEHDSNSEYTEMNTKDNKDLTVSETTQEPPINNNGETAYYHREEQAGKTHTYYSDELKAKGWEVMGLAYDYYFNGVWVDEILIAGFDHIIYPAPHITYDQYLYTVTGWKQDVRGKIVISIMVVFDEGAAEGKLVDMYYAINTKDGPVMSAEPFDFQILSPDDENLWNYLLSS